MKQDFGRVHFRTIVQKIGRQLFLEPAKPVDLVGNQNDELQVAAAVGQRDGRKSLALRVTKLGKLLHRWKGDGVLSADMKRLRLGCVSGKLARPGRLKIKRVCEDQTRGGNERLWDQIADSIARLLRHPVIDFFCRCARIVHKVENLRRGSEVLFDLGEKLRPKFITGLGKQSIRDRHCDRFTRSAVLL